MDRRLPPELVALAGLLSQEYFDRAFARPDGRQDREIEVSADQRVLLRSRVVEQGLRVWLVFKRDVLWWPVRRRRPFRGEWASVAALPEVEAAARDVLDHYLS